MYRLPASVGWEMKFVHSKNFGCGALFVVRERQLRLPHNKYGHYSVICPKCGRRVIIPRRLISKEILEKTQVVLSKRVLSKKLKKG